MPICIREVILNAAGKRVHSLQEAKILKEAAKKLGKKKKVGGSKSCFHTLLQNLHCLYHQIYNQLCGCICVPLSFDSNMHCFIGMCA